MIHNQGTFCGTGDLELFIQSWQPSTTPQAALVLVHGMGDHCGRFERLVVPLVEREIAVYGFDLRGFGRSPGRKGHINDWEEYLNDLRAFLDLVRAQQPGVPLFLLGYSLGAAIVLDDILQDTKDLRGAVLIGAPIEPAGVASRPLVMLARLLSRLLPTFTLRMPNHLHGVSRDPAVLDALAIDPLHHSFATARFGAESLIALERIRASANQIRLPVLFLHGSDDPFNLVRGTQRYFNEITHPDKTLIIYPGSRHEVHNDLEHAQVAEDISRWILSH